MEVRWALRMQEEMGRGMVSPRQMRVGITVVLLILILHLPGVDELARANTRQHHIAAHHHCLLLLSIVIVYHCYLS
jgi:hypothetical protein